MNKVVTDEQYFVLAHFVVLSCNYIQKAIETFGLKKKYIELLYELLMFSGVF